MRFKHLIGIAILALLPLSAFAWGVVSISGGVAAPAATCETAKDSETTSYSAFTFGNASVIGCASSFTATATYTLCALDVNLYRSGTTDSSYEISTVTAYIYSDDAANSTPVDTGEAGGPLATSTNTVSYETINANGASYSADNYELFTFAGVSIQSGTKYWIVLICDAQDASDYVKWQRHNSETDPAEDMASTVAGTTWTSSDGYQGLFHTYASE